MNEVCFCGKPITVMAFKGTKVCSVVCKKKYIGDVSSVGTFMFVTTEERNAIVDARGADANV